jgi:hypothetical protein
MNAKALITATAAGSVLQLAMVIAGHWIVPIQSTFLVGGLLLSAVAGALPATMTRGSLSADLVSGLIAGGACAFIGILVSFLLGDVPGSVLVFGTGGSAVTGLIGSAIIRSFRR